jgi:hypothetical protein
MRASRKYSIAAIAATAMVGGFAAFSAAPAFADTPAPGTLSFSIQNPVTASLALSTQNVSLISAGTGANTAAATAAPFITFANNGGKSVGGGVQVKVESDSPNGYTLTLNGSAGGIMPVGGGAAVDTYNLNIVTEQIAGGANGGSLATTDNHFVPAPGSDPAANGVTVLSTTGASGTVTDQRDSGGANATPVDTATSLTPDALQTAYYVQPKSGMLPGHNYTESASFTYLAKP